MARSSPRRTESPLPACFATVQPGMEPMAADEITRDLGGDVKKAARGIVVFRVNAIDERLLALRTTEDVFLLAWGSDSLSYSSADLKTIQSWTARKADWPALFRIHHALRPMKKGKPTFHLVAQMQGEHGYRRVDALDAMADGLAGKIPAGWLPAEENAWLEIWLQILGKTAVCGLRLSDRTMRHRTYKTEHVAASLRPTVAAAMVRLAGAGPGMTVLDPMCGAGTILAEQIELARKRKAGTVAVLGGDEDPNAVHCADENLAGVGPAELVRWDATALPLSAASVDRVISNPPFGKQLSAPEKIGELYRHMVREADRVLIPGGRAVYLVGEPEPLRAAAEAVRWVPIRQLRLRVLGQQATLAVWNKPG
ncbi:MAG TPA: methyltransferase [Fimbriiglobus sp.]